MWVDVLIAALLAVSWINWGALQIAAMLGRAAVGVAELFSQLDYLVLSVTVVLVWGVNLIFWGVLGLVRMVIESLSSRHRKTPDIASIKAEVLWPEVAVLVPAHNEELVIADTLNSLLRLVRPHNLFVVSDGSSDGTVRIVRQFGVNVLDLSPSHGKAGALEACLKHFNILVRFRAVLFVDADTRLHPDYLRNALPFFRDPNVAAVAGYAQTIWNPEKLSWSQKLFVLHRDRIYFLSQRFIKFGQTWKQTSVTHIVPGFASLYRTSALSQICMNPPGLVIEDFNMTFEVHRKRLGVIAHHPSAVAYTQDPDNWGDYFRQIKRWHLGFWQTIRLHGFWPSKFWAAMMVTLVEVVSGGVLFLCLPAVVLMWYLPDLVSLLPASGSWLWIGQLREVVHVLPLWSWLVFGILVPDYLLTVAVAAVQKRPQYLIFGLGFPFIRYLDALAFLVAIPKAYLVSSNGRWVSPTRRSG